MYLAPSAPSLEWHIACNILPWKMILFDLIRQIIVTEQHSCIVHKGLVLGKQSQVSLLSPQSQRGKSPRTVQEITLVLDSSYIELCFPFYSLFHLQICGLTKPSMWVLLCWGNCRLSGYRFMTGCTFLFFIPSQVVLHLCQVYCRDIYLT